MQFHLDRALRLNADPKKGLYTWWINEVLENGEAAPDRDQIPWIWTLYFTATDCVLGNSIALGPDYAMPCEERTTKASEVQQIRMRLRSGARQDAFWRQTRFSMFGTDRNIEDIGLVVYPLAGLEEKERCRAWGFVSYTSEVDFSKETQDDTLQFELHVRPEAFSRYAGLVQAGTVHEMMFSVGQVAGFYSDWSPSISTNKVKVLAAHKEQQLENVSGLDLEPPRLGDVGECALYINRRITFEKSSEGESPTERTEHSGLDHVGAVRNALRAERVTPASEVQIVPERRGEPATAVDAKLSQTLRSLRTAAWWCVGLLAIIAVKLLWR